MYVQENVFGFLKEGNVHTNLFYLSFQNQITHFLLYLHKTQNSLFFRPIMDLEIYTMRIGHTVLAKEPLIDLWKDLSNRGFRQKTDRIEYMYFSVLPFVIRIHVLFCSLFCNRNICTFSFIFCNRRTCISLYPLL